MQKILFDDVVDKFVNNTIYQSEPILNIVYIAMVAAQINPDEIPLTVISPFHNIPNKVGYYYTPAQLQRDWMEGMFPMSKKEFDRAQHGVVRLKLDFLVGAKQFLTAAIHEYTHAVQYAEETETMRIIGEDPMVVDAKEKAAYKLSEKLACIVGDEGWTIDAIKNLNNELEGL